MMFKQWKKEQVWPYFGYCTADSQTDAARHQLYNNGSLVLFYTASFMFDLSILRTALKMSKNHLETPAPGASPSTDFPTSRRSAP